MSDNEDDGDWSPWEKEVVGGTEVDEEDLDGIDPDERSPLVSSVPHLLQVSNEDLVMGDDESTRLLGSTPASRPQFLTAFIVTLGAFTMGCVIGYSSPAGPLLMTNTTDSSIILTEGENSWFSSSMAVGALFGAPISGFCLSTIGRKRTLQAFSVPFAIGWFIIAFASDFAMLMVGRVLTGLCSGVVSMAIPTYIGEFASPNLRGTLGSSFQLMVTIGVLYAMTVGAFLTSWKWLAGLCAIPAILFFLLLFFVKESPVFLLTKGKEEEADKALKYFRGSEYNTQTELDMLRESIEESKRNKASFKDLIKPYNIKPLLISVGLMFFQQFSGVNPVLFNLSIVFQDSGSTMKAAYSAIIIGAVQVAATFFSVIVVDKAGRKVLLIASSSVMALSLVALGEFFYLKMEDEAWAVSTLGWLPLVSLIFFILSFSYGYGPIPWLMVGELFSSDVKELAASVSVVSNWTMAFIVMIIYLPMQHVLLDHGVYWLFSGICILGLIFSVLIVPETKGKSLEEICAYFGAPRVDSIARQGSRF